MITKKINIKPHLAEYLVAKYNKSDFTSPIRFPDKLDLYHIIYNLLERRPANAKEEEGNLWFYLPVVYNGKNPQQFNYLGKNSVKKIQNKIKNEFWAEAHEYINEQKHIMGKTYSEAVYMFMNLYGITEITEDAILKNFRRWRDKTRRTNPRKYVKRKKIITEQVI